MSAHVGVCTKTYSVNSKSAMILLCAPIVATTCLNLRFVGGTCSKSHTVEV